jgi:hypothetical protein
MVERYFEKFPTITYNGHQVVDITKRVGILNTIYSNPYLYYQYDVNSGERADIISNRYYNDQFMSWILYMSNKIVDPYYDWYIDTDTFNNFLAMKYGSLANAYNKVKYYRNNWYSASGPISVSSYNNLTASLRDYYQPNYGDVVNSSTPLSYDRKQIDWTVATNGIAGYNVANGTNFIDNEIVKVVFDSTHTGNGQVIFANSSYVSIQHLSGTTTTGTIVTASYLYGNESGVNTNFTTATSIANNISTAESSYWSPVYYYDYENEINQKNKSIRALNNQYSKQISAELKTLLNK